MCVGFFGNRNQFFSTIFQRCRCNEDFKLKLRDLNLEIHYTTIRPVRHPCEGQSDKDRGDGSLSHTGGTIKYT